jgi:YggT family protein
LETLVGFIVSLIYLALGVLQLLLMVRAILSWLPFDDSAPFVNFIIIATEPFIFPVRQLLEKSSFFSSLPIDLSLFVAYLLLIFVRALLPAVSF